VTPERVAEVRRLVAHSVGVLRYRTSTWGSIGANRPGPGAIAAGSLDTAAKVDRGGDNGQPVRTSRRRPVCLVVAMEPLAATSIFFWRR
jgi:hypothetical protein